jgi:hypothetical protein
VSGLLASNAAFQSISGYTVTEAMETRSLPPVRHPGQHSLRHLRMGMGPAIRQNVDQVM